MKKLKVIALFLAVAVILSGTMLFGVSADNEDFTIDADNSSGISVWSAVPFVSRQNILDGYSGGEGCQHMNSVTRDTSDGNLVFIGTDVGGMFRSTDGGRSWSSCNRGINTRGVCRVAIDPMNKNHLVAQACSGSALKYNALYFSYDMGDNWTKSKNTQLGMSSGYYIYNSLQFDASSYDEQLGYCTDVYWSTPYERDSSTLISAEAAGLYYSSDGGSSFEKLASEQNVFDGILIIDNSVIYLANQYGIFVKDGDAQDFTQVYFSAVQSFIKRNGVFYIMTDDGIYTSSDLVDYSKIESTNFPSGREPRNLDVSPLNPMHMVLVAKKSSIKYSQRPYYSEDGGITWSLADISDKSGVFYYYTYTNNAFSFSPTVEGEVVAFQGGTAVMSTDWGKTWKSSNTGINNVMCGGKFNFNIYDSNLIYVGAQDFGGAISEDGGKTWEPLLLSKDNDGRNTYGGYAADRNTVFGVYTEQWGNSTLRAQQRYVCFSHDAGKTVNITITELEADASQFENIRVSEKIKCSWESSYQSPNDKNVLFCANYRSEDYGYTWVNMLDSEADTKCLQVYTHSGKTLYGAYDGAGYVVKSEDDGKSWSKVNSDVLAGTDYHISDIAVDGINGYIYAVFSSKLYRMRLDGSEITDLTPRMAKDNMGVRRIITAAVDPRHPEIVYCGGSGDYYQSTCGVRRSCDSGETWYTVSASSAADCIVKDGPVFGFEPKCLRVNPETGYVWNGSSCLGFNKLSPPYEEKVQETTAPIETTAPTETTAPIETTAPTNPSGADITTCSHLCHKSGFLGSIWRLFNFFNRLFGINQYCSCGEKHW